MKIQLYLCVFFGFIVMDISSNSTTIHSDITNDLNVNNSSDFMETMKQMMWKQCSNNSYAMCAKMALMQALEKLNVSEKYNILPGVSIIYHPEHSKIDENLTALKSNDAIDKYLLARVKVYLSSLTLNVKLLDRNTMNDVRSFGEKIVGTGNHEGRGRKKYSHSLMMAGIMSGGTLLALTLKTIALLSGKALLAALLSLMISVVSSFSKGHGESKSTTYEIIAKPIIAHTHDSTSVHESQVNDHNPTYVYRRSFNFDNTQFGNHARGLSAYYIPNSGDDVVHEVYPDHNGSQQENYSPHITN